MTGVMGFFILYMFIFAISSLIMSLFTQDIATACSAVISSMSNVGPGFGEIGPMDNFANLHDFAKIFLIHPDDGRTSGNIHGPRSIQ